MTTTRTTWGATRSGRTGFALWGPAALIGVAIAGAIGVVVALVTPAPQPVLLGVLTGVMGLPIAVALGWALLVDRASLKGAVDKPEDSVESDWLRRAAEGALFDGLAMIGLGAGVIAVTRIDVPADLVLMAVWLVLVVDLGVRYLVLKRS